MDLDNQIIQSKMLLVFISMTGEEYFAMTENKRVYCLYRVSTNKQVDYNKDHEADIPMQREACRQFAKEKGWTIVGEEQEEGVSGHKVRAENRDKLQLIREYAMEGKFDVLLVFMFDRIGRIADETPFVVEWFVKNGIEVWSTQEGEQRFDNHTDKLLNYIRFWQADGESEKTSIRTRTRLGQLTEEGRFKGGNAPYGYDLVKSGQVNKKKHEVSELAVNEAEAAVVRIIFDKYVNEGYGAQRIATYLNEQGYRARTGKPWHHASIRGIICNLTYTGVLRCGESRSPVLPQLQIISPEQYEEAQCIREERSRAADENRTVPINTKGQSLLAGNVFCGHCGSRLTLTTSGKYSTRKDGSVDKTPRIRYVCYGKTRKQTECDGQTGYTMHILDGLIDKLVRKIFANMRSISREDLINQRFEEGIAEKQAHVELARKDCAAAAEDLAALKSEVVRSLRGQSAFSAEMLSGLITEAEEKYSDLKAVQDRAEEDLKNTQEEMSRRSHEVDTLISYADLYDSASIEAKKMIINCLIRRVDVYRGYRLKVEFNFSLEQYLSGIDREDFLEN